jgi:nitrate/nitrite-specific signal transduction histidine kinase
MIDEQGPTAAYYREVAARIRDLAWKAQLPEVRSEMAELAERFERMAAYVEKRYPNGRGRVPAQGGGNNS